MAGELLAVYRLASTPGGDALRNEKLSSWGGPPDTTSRPPHGGVWPSEAMTSVLLGLGEWQGQHRRVELAGALLRKAATLHPHGIEVRAVQKLVELYVELDDVQRVNRLLAEYEGQLFSAKSAAYARGRPEEIYQFHRTMGELYGYLATTGSRPWGSPSEPGTASFQLQHAYDTWQRIPEPQKPPLDPGVVELLARSYHANGNSEREMEVRIDAAQVLERQGDLRGRDALIRPVDETALPPAQKEKIRDLRSRSSAGIERRPVKSQRQGPTDITRSAGADSLALRSDIQMGLSRRRGTLTVFTGKLEHPVPEGAARDLAAALQTWLDQGEPGADPYRRADRRPKLVKSWDGKRGVAILEIDGKQVEVPFALAPE